MTTIAWDGKTLAADMAITAGWQRLDTPMEKVAAGPGVLGAAAGSTTYCAAFRKWVEGGCAGDAPEAKSSGDSTDRGLLIRATEDGHFKAICHEEGGTFELFEQFFAMGSGKEYALGAMAAGADAVAAVNAAIRFDVMSGGGVMHVTLAQARLLAKQQSDRTRIRSVTPFAP